MKVIVVTHAGPCFVSESVFKKIEARKKESQRFSRHILFSLRLKDVDRLNVEVKDGEVPDVDSFAEFEEKYIVEGSHGHGRNIIV